MSEQTFLFRLVCFQLVRELVFDLPSTARVDFVESPEAKRAQAILVRVESDVLQLSEPVARFAYCGGPTAYFHLTRATPNPTIIVGMPPSWYDDSNTAVTRIRR